MPDTAKITRTKPARSHKSKKEQAKKSTACVVNGGFIERTRNPEVTGEAVKSQMMRVSADFAGWVRAQAMQHGISITEVTRMLYLELADTAE